MSIALPLRPAASRRPLSYGRLDDARLARLAADGDERAFEAIFDRHHAPLLAFCRHMLSSREEGEDALQQTFMRAHRALVDHGAPDELRPWLYAIARNRCRSALAARRDGAVPVESLEVSVDGLADEVQQRAELRAVVADLANLPEDQRGALVLAELDDLSHAQIAAILGCPVGRVKALVFQAREALLADRAARAIPCADIREQLATARGGALRRGPLKRHVRGCDGCRTFAAGIRDQRAALACVLPVAPTVGLKAAIIAATTGGGGGGAIAAAGLASSGGGLLAKLGVGAAIAAVGVGGGAVVVEEILQKPARGPAQVRNAGAPQGGPQAPAGQGSGPAAAVGGGGAPQAVAVAPVSDRSERAKRRADARRRQARRAARRARRRASRQVAARPLAPGQNGSAGAKQPGKRRATPTNAPRAKAKSQPAQRPSQARRQRQRQRQAERRAKREAERTPPRALAPRPLVPRNPVPRPQPKRTPTPTPEPTPPPPAAETPATPGL